MASTGATNHCRWRPDCCHLDAATKDKQCDNRSEWWRRFTWAVETVDNDKATEQCRRAAEIQLDCLSESPLARSSEQSLIAQFYEMDDNEPNIIGEKDGGNDDNNVD